ncbi:bestrophin family protein [Pseudomonas putida]|uniref:bestrophin family protein n=1 Tax=Pseudomonas putida TaxID=303 RepID=UPI00236432C7|nr:bestrophin family protein [Pseudomonas putida]MDD1967554.1 bestrophin family protein [Pseudomonas putida]
MIVRPHPNLLNVLSTLKGSIARRIAGRSLLVTLLAAGIVLIESLHPDYFAKVSATPFTLLGLSLSIFMSFRNNACYDRWYEARKAWGDIITETRSIIRETQAIKDDGARATILRDLCGFAHGLNAALRCQDARKAMAPWVSQLPALNRANCCDVVLRDVGRKCSEASEAGQISEWRYTLLANHLSVMSRALTTCDRIKNTPLPFPYTLLLHRTIYLFCILLPFAMAEPLGWMTPLFMAIVSYTFFGLDAIGNELEDPFGYDENDLPLDALVRVIERDILDALGVQPLPPVLEPVEFVLT